MIPVEKTLLYFANPSCSLRPGVFGFRVAELVPGGADILNETIIDSLLQERYRRVLQGPRTPDIGEHADKGEQPSSG